MMHRVLLVDTETTGLPRTAPDGTLIQPRIGASPVCRPHTFVRPQRTASSRPAGSQKPSTRSPPNGADVPWTREPCDNVDPRPDYENVLTD